MRAHLCKCGLLTIDGFLWELSPVWFPRGTRLMGHQRAFSARSTMDRSNSWLIGISSVIISCGTPRITAIHKVCPGEPAQSIAECRRRATCSRASKTVASVLFCLYLPIFAYVLRHALFYVALRYLEYEENKVRPTGLKKRRSNSHKSQSSKTLFLRLSCCSLRNAKCVYRWLKKLETNLILV